MTFLALAPVVHNPLKDVTEYIELALTRYSDLFLGVGWNIFRALAVILIAWFGVQAALSAASGGTGFPLARLARLMMSIAFCYGMIAFYNVPIPGTNVDFRHLITDQASWIVATLQTRAVDDINTAIDQAWSRVGPPPSMFDYVGGLIYILLYALMTGVRFVVFFVTAFGMVAVAVVAMLGPLFIPFYLVPDLDWLFWGWIRSFIGYALYRVVAEVYVFIWSGFLLRFLQGFQDFDQVRVGTYGVLVFAILLSFIVGILKIPSLAASIVSGRSGESAFWTF
jgi:hypothetical protein